MLKEGEAVSDTDTELLLDTAAERQLVVLGVLVFETEIERVSVTETVEVREEVVVLETVGELVMEPVKVPDMEEDTLRLPLGVSELLTEDVAEGLKEELSDERSETDTLTDAEELIVRPEALGFTVKDTLSVRDTVSVSV